MTNVLLATSNGTGMGHLTRQAAVALALGDQHQSTIFSLSLGLPLVIDLGIPGEYCPSYDRPWIASRDWHAYLRDRLVALVEETRAQAVVFDGVAPYPGIGMAALALRDVAFVWLRRGMWREANRTQLRKRRYFDLVVEPGDLSASADEGPTARLGDAERVGPISILEALGTHSREAARHELGLPSDGPVALVTLGSGRLGDVAGPGRVAVETLLEQPDWHVAVTKSPVALNEVPLGTDSRLTEIRGVYPLARYMSAFDLAVSSAGYNSVHELVPARVPTVFVANTSTRADDQRTRAQWLERNDLALAVDDTDIDSLRPKLHSLLNGARRAEIAQKAATTRALLTGASEVGRVVVDHAETFGVRRRAIGALVTQQVQRTKDVVKEVLGESKTDSVKRMLGRHPTVQHDRTRVRVTDHVGDRGATEPVELAFVQSVSGEELRYDQPVEHVLAGTSSDYRERRRRLIEEYYDVES